MFTDFEYAGKRLSDFGWITCHIDNRPGVSELDIGCDITFNTVKNNHSSIHYVTSTSYDNVCTSQPFEIMKNPCGKNQEDLYAIRDEIRVLTTWLNRHDYRKFKPLYDSDEWADIHYYGSFNVKEKTIGDKIIGLVLTFTGNAPYGFGEHIFNEIDMDNNEVTVSGEFIHVEDSADSKIVNFSIQGNTEQKTTEGKNLWDKEFASDINNWILNDDNPYYKRVAVYVGKGRDITLSYPTPPTGLESLYACVTLEDSYLSIYKEWLYHETNDSLINTCVTLNASMDDYIYIWCLKNGIENGNFMQYIGDNLQIEYGAIATDFEEYTGRMASPNMKYKQHIIHTGQKLVEGNQLFDASKIQGKVEDLCSVINNGDGSLNIIGSGNLSGTFNCAYVDYELHTRLKVGALYLNNNNVTYPYFHLYGTDNNNSTLFTLTNGNHVNITQDILDKLTKVIFSVYGSTGYEVVEGTIKPMLYQDGDGTWEPYTGGVKKVVDIGNIVGKVLGKNFIPQTQKISLPDFTASDNGTHYGYSDYIRVPSGIKLKFNAECIVRQFDSFLNLILDKQTVNNFETTLENTKFIKVRTTKEVRALGEGFELVATLEPFDTSYEPYTEQSITITSDKPITKWDKLIEKDGQIGWGYRGVKLIIDGNSPLSKYDSYNYNGFQCNGILPEKMRRRDGFCNQFIVINQSESDAGLNYTPNSIWLGVDSNTIYFIINDFYDASLEDYGVANFKAHLSEHPLEIWTYTDEVEFVPLPEEEQEAIRNLMMYHPITNIYSDQDVQIEVTYLQDYDNEIIICGDGDEYTTLYPNISITCKRDGDLKIKNTLTGEIFEVLNCSKDETIYVNGEHKYIDSDNQNHKETTLFNDFNYNYLDINITNEDFNENIYETSIPCKIVIDYSPIRKVGV